MYRCSNGKNLSHDLSQFCVAAIAERFGFGVFAAAEIGLAGRFRGPGNGCDAGLLVRAIAERLLLGLSAGAPIISFSGLDIDGIGCLLRDLAFCHLITPERGALRAANRIVVLYQTCVKARNRSLSSKALKHDANGCDF
jgi:hypothetical protein